MKIVLEVPEFIIERVLECKSVSEVLRPSASVDPKVMQIAATLDWLHKVVVQQLGTKGRI